MIDCLTPIILNEFICNACILTWLKHVLYVKKAGNAVFRTRGINTSLINIITGTPLKEIGYVE